MPRTLVIMRRLALVGVVLSILAVPLGLVALFIAQSPDIGDNGLGDAIAFGLGVLLALVGVAGLILGSGLAVLARRAMAAPAEIRGSRRSVLAAGLIVAGGQVALATLLGGPWVLFVGLGSAFAAGFLVVAAASRRAVDPVVAGVLAVALLGAGGLLIWDQASRNASTAQQRDRTPLVFLDLSVAIDAAAAVAPDGWALATLAARATNLAPNEQLRFLPEALIGQPLRGLVVVDCAGSERLEVVARDGEASVTLGTIPCAAEPQVLAIEIPASVVHTDPSATYVLGIEADATAQGPSGGMNRAMVLVGLTGTPEPARDALIAAFVAAFGTEDPR